MSINDSEQSIQAKDLPLTRSIVLGLRVIGSELHWSILHALRKWDINQMDKRLQKEYQRLGQLHRLQDQGQHTEENEQEVELCRQQIDFLEKEMQFLQQELDKLREEHVRQRRRKWKV